MSRRSSNTVRMKREAAARVGTTLDRNGIPVLDDPKRANRLPKFCPDGEHLYIADERRFIGTRPDGADIFSITKRCARCMHRSVETKSVAYDEIG